VPQARGSYQARDLEESERERGNAEFKAGNFTAATKCYTKCLGMKARNYVAFSNRAMAYLKLKEYARAVVSVAKNAFLSDLTCAGNTAFLFQSDCNCALLIEPGHVKSLLRRSTAYNALGKHRAALRDLQAAAALEPGK
jgi:tetratricopeptide (TPR) repeat protein